MSWWAWVLLAVVLWVVVGWYLSSTAGRLDRLHRRVDAGRMSLDNELLRRSSVVTELSGTMLPDPGGAILLADAAHEARLASDSDDVTRGLAESNLTQILGEVFADPEAVEVTDAALGGHELTDELASASRRVEMSRRFLNDAVRACVAVREQRLVRWLGLAGHTPLPEPFEMNDTPPVGFGVR
jgi:hypothetical protein